MSASENNEKKVKPVIKDSPTGIKTSPSGSACTCSADKGRDIYCKLHGG
jgi:hypothetical protein|tara:strand:+ start:172 stop:318 length:147 start_codon:yes stop_codon:yes gene_type:complete